MKKATSHLANDASDQTNARTLQGWWPVNLVAETAELEARAWKAIKKARDALRLPVPDTFLGRRHYDFIPPPDENKE